MYLSSLRIVNVVILLSPPADTVDIIVGKEGRTHPPLPLYLLSPFYLLGLTRRSVLKDPGRCNEPIPATLYRTPHRTAFRTFGITQRITDISGPQTFAPLAFGHAAAGTFPQLGHYSNATGHQDAHGPSDSGQDLSQVSLVFT
jgi:hypothetical protein